MYQLWTLFWWVFVQDSNSVFGDIDATQANLMEAAQYFVCVVNGIHGRALASNIDV